MAIAPVVTLSSWSASLVVWPLAALALALSGWRESDAGIRWAERGFAAWWASLVPGIALAYAGRPTRMVALAIIVGAAVVLIASALRDREGRCVGAADLGAGAAMAIGLILGTVPGLDALPWTVAGAGVTVAGLVNRRRRWCHAAGPALLGIAYIVRLAESRVDVVEAYTAPFAVGLLGVGLWALRKQEIGTVRALGPGVTLALLPSLPQALDEPTSLRALLLGLVAVAFLAIGLMRRWRAPFVGGTTVTLLLVIANIGPWAMALPRWVAHRGARSRGHRDRGDVGVPGPQRPHRSRPTSRACAEPTKISAFVPTVGHECRVLGSCVRPWRRPWCGGTPPSRRRRRERRRPTQPAPAGPGHPRR